MKPETRWKAATVVLLLLVIYLVVLAIQAKQRADAAEDVIARYVDPKLDEEGFVPGDYDKTPDVATVVPGTKPIVHAKGTVRYAPRSIAAPARLDPPSEPPQPATDTAWERAPAAPATVPCSLDDLDVTIDCTVDALATPTKPWVKLVTSGTIKAWGQTRELPEAAAGNVNFDIVPSVVPPTWHLDFLAGVAAGSRFGVEAGAAWTGRSRLGWYTMVEWQPATGGTAYDSYTESTYSTAEPATWRVHAGVRVRIK